MGVETSRHIDKNSRRSRAPYMPDGSPLRKRLRGYRLSASTITAITKLRQLDNATEDHVITSAVMLYALHSQGEGFVERHFAGHTN